MTTRTGIFVMCDEPGCTRWAGTRHGLIVRAREQVASLGWTHHGKLGDRCPRHSAVERAA